MKVAPFGNMGRHFYSFLRKRAIGKSPPRHFVALSHPASGGAQEDIKALATHSRKRGQVDVVALCFSP